MAMKVHKLKVTSRWGGTMSGSVCGRLNSACADGMNVSDKDAEVTCRFCLRDMEITKRLREAKAKRESAR